MDLTVTEGRKELGQRIQSAVASAGYPSLTAFAEALGCSRALIYQYVNGEVLAQLDRLTEIARLTDRPLQWFLADDPSGVSRQEAELEEHLQRCRSRCEELERSLAAERQARLDQSHASRQALVETLQELCHALRRSGDMRELMETAVRWREVAAELGDTASMAAADLHLGHAAYGLGDMHRAQKALEAALEQARASGHRAAELSARQERVRVWQAAGKLEQARGEAEELAESQQWWPRWSAVVTLAALAEQEGRLQVAREHLQRAEELLEEAPAEALATARTYVQSNQVNLALASGDYGRALAEANTHYRLAAEAGLPDQIREAILNRAIASLRSGQVEQAEELLERLSELAEHADDRRLRALAEIFTAELLTRRGQFAEARRLAQEAIELANETGPGLAVAEGQLALGRAFLADGMCDDAIYHLRRCQQRAARLGLARLRLQAAMLLAVAEADETLLDQLQDEASERGYRDLEEGPAALLADEEDAIE
ncbi:MAG: helix-turn-helix transcriptional regulator [Armatimonadota bacterium]|nr:helix-turn-helix transcriptional regulator [Armatimonadota bacterium]